ncbi:MAG TPA: hypothetical protein VNH18_08315 [Bryobacteraceae bacterium]|nr:hypothetical protein [Bryobacteraceae bacterium]
MANTLLRDSSQRAPFHTRNDVRSPAQRGFDAHAVNLRGHGDSDGRDKLRWTRIADYVEDVSNAVWQLPSLEISNRFYLQPDDTWVQIELVLWWSVAHS